MFHEKGTLAGGIHYTWRSYLDELQIVSCKQSAAII